MRADWHERETDGAVYRVRSGSSAPAARLPEGVFGDESLRFHGAHQPREQG